VLARYVLVWATIIKAKAQHLKATPTLALFISADAACSQKDANF
jgi:hypothetical protein